jgi:hypothetical protein
VVVRHGEGLEYERDHVLERATWSFQAAPAVAGMFLAFVMYGVWRLLQRLSPGRKRSSAVESDAS